MAAYSVPCTVSKVLYKLGSENYRLNLGHAVFDQHVPTPQTTLSYVLLVFVATALQYIQIVIRNILRDRRKIDEWPGGRVSISIESADGNSCRVVQIEAGWGTYSAKYSAYTVHATSVVCVDKIGNRAMAKGGS